MKKNLLIKKIFVICFTIIALYGCEKNDLCDGVSQTPRLHIELRDLFAPENPKTANLVELHYGNTNNFIEYKNTATLYIPISPMHNQAEWTIKLYHLDNANEKTLLGEEKFNFTYTPKNIYISKACGFRTQFEAFSYQRQQTNTQWIKGIDLTTNTISNETDIHFLLFY